MALLKDHCNRARPTTRWSGSASPASLLARAPQWSWNTEPAKLRILRYSRIMSIAWNEATLSHCFERVHFSLKNIRCFSEWDFFLPLDFTPVENKPRHSCRCTGAAWFRFCALTSLVTLKPPVIPSAACSQCLLRCRLRLHCSSTPCLQKEWTNIPLLSGGVDKYFQISR